MEILSSMTGKELISGIKQEVKQDQDGRQEYLRQSSQNILYIYGRHYHYASRNHFSNELIDNM